MTAIVPIAAESIDGYDAPDRPWSEVQACLDTDDGRVRRAWLSTTCPDGTPHTMPLSAIWFDGAFYFNSGARTRKGRNLAANPRSVLTFSAGGFDLVFQGMTSRITDEPSMDRLLEVYRANGWPARVQGRPVLRTVQRAERRAAAVEPVSDDRHNRFRSGCRGTVQRHALAVLNQGEQARYGSAIQLRRMGCIG
jgi:pyridoxamine 5'-phosphate oxidase-like protein